MATKPNGRKASATQAPQMPLPGTHEVTLHDGQKWTYPDSFMQIGSAEVAGALLIFHASGMYTMAIFAPGTWVSAQRVAPAATVTVPAEVESASAPEAEPAP